MAKFTGDRANLTFNGVDYYCLQDFNLPRSVQEATGQCSGATGAETFRAPGAKDATLTVNILLEQGTTGGVTHLNNLEPGTTGPLEFHPEGPASTGDIEYLFTDVLITQSTEAGATGSLTVQTVVFGLNGSYTIQAVP